MVWAAGLARLVLQSRRRRFTKLQAMVWVAGPARDRGESVQSLILKKLTFLAGDAEVDNRLKRERQTSSGSDDVLIERKTVKVMIVPRPDNALIDEPYGTTKLDCVNIPGGRTYCTRRESLSENDKG